MPTFNPTLTPTTDPSGVPTLDPTESPTAFPTMSPSAPLPILPVPLFVSHEASDPKVSSSVATANYYYVFHLYRFTYYKRYEELIKDGRDASQARAAATAAAEDAVKNAQLPYKVSPAIQIEAPAADAIAAPTLAEGTPSATSLTAQAAAAPVK